MGAENVSSSGMYVQICSMYFVMARFEVTTRAPKSLHCSLVCNLCSFFHLAQGFP